MKLGKKCFNKKVVSSLFISMMFFSTIPRVYADTDVNRNINDVYNYGERSNDDSSSISLSGNLGDKKIGVSDLNFNGTDSSKYINSLPSKYDPREKDYMTPIRDQEDLGICWTFAGEGILESYLKRNGYGNYDLSEEHMRWWGKNGSHNWNIGDEEGATNEASIGYFTSWSGPKLEKDIPYNGKQTENKGAKKPSNYDSAPMLDYQVLDVVNVAKDQQSVKNAIMRYGAVTSGYYDSPKYISNDGNSFYCSKSLGQNHAIIIVGWDDDYSKTNFKEGDRPSSNGAWLVKNSWGDYNSEKGYLWISYEDKTILSFTDNYAIARIQKNKQQKMYQHEYSMSSTLKENNLFALNRFNFGENEALEGVMFATDSVGARYEIYYIPEESGRLVYKDRIFIKSGIVPFSGYITVDIDNFPLATGHGAIGVKLDNSKNRSKASIGLEKNVNKFSMFVSKAYPGESYIYKNGRFIDLNVDGGLGPVNLVIKAITKPFNGGNTIIGKDRYDTALKIANLGFSSSENAVLVNGDAISDALTATPLASEKSAPILLIGRNYINESVIEKLRLMGTKNITLIGGINSISTNVETSLRNLGYNVNRIFGENRYETSYEIAKNICDNYKDVNSIAVVNGIKGLADAISFSSVAGHNMIPILLADNSGNLKREVNSIIGDKKIVNTYIIGGTNSIPDTVDNTYTGSVRLSGENRNETNAKIIKKFYPDKDIENIFVVNDGSKNQNVLIDGLAVGSYAAKINSPILLVKDVLSKGQKEVISEKKFKKVTQVGGGLNSIGITEVLVNNNKQ